MTFCIEFSNLAYRHSRLCVSYAPFGFGVWRTNLGSDRGGSESPD